MVENTSTVAYRALSLGAGVQSSVLALLLSRSDSRLVKEGYPVPDIAVFADTGWEPEYVYEHLDWLEKQLDYPLVRVSNGSLKANLPKAVTPSGKSFVDVPLFTVDGDGKKGILRRQCTGNYKIKPIYRCIRELAGGLRGRRFPKGSHVEMWLGISLDEISRMKPSRERWVEHRWPLIDIGMTRHDCVRWFHSEYPGRYLPRSACIICPYHTDRHWQEMRDNDPESFEEAVFFDRWLRSSRDNPVRKLLKGEPYLHSSRRPLDVAILEKEKQDSELLSLFDNECEGLCGV